MAKSQYLGWGAILLAVIMAGAEYLNSPSSLIYLWAVIVAAWGIWAMKGK